MSNNIINFSQQNLHYSKYVNDVLNYSCNGNNTISKLVQTQNRNEIDLNISLKNCDDNINNEKVKIIIMKNPKNPSNMLIQIFPSYFYNLEINKEQYEKIKQEQGLLINFEEFPDYINKLLDNCKNNQGNKFTCIIERKKNENLFIIEEKTEYKMMSHIVLKIDKEYDMLPNHSLFNSVNDDYKEKYDILLKENKELKDIIEKLENMIKKNKSSSVNNSSISSTHEIISKGEEKKIEIAKTNDIFTRELSMSSCDQINIFKSQIDKLQKEILDLKKQNFELTQIKDNGDIKSKFNNTLHSQLEDKIRENIILEKEKKQLENKLKEIKIINDEYSKEICNQKLCISELKKDSEKKEKEINQLKNQLFHYNNKNTEGKNGVIRRNNSQRNHPNLLNENNLYYKNSLKSNNSKLNIKLNNNNSNLGGVPIIKNYPDNTENNNFFYQKNKPMSEKTINKNKRKINVNDKNSIYKNKEAMKSEINQILYSKINEDDENNRINPYKFK